METIVGIELLLAAQGVDFRCRAMGVDAACLGAGTGVAYHLIRERIPFLDADVPLSPHIEAARRLVAEGTLKWAVEERLQMA